MANKIAKIKNQLNKEMVKGFKDFKPTIENKTMTIEQVHEINRIEFTSHIDPEILNKVPSSADGGPIEDRIRLHHFLNSFKNF